MESSRVEQTARQFATVWGSGDLATDVATTLGCGEVEALAAMLRAAGAAEAATAWIEWHAEGDDEGDAHYRATNNDQATTAASIDA